MIQYVWFTINFCFSSWESKYLLKIRCPWGLNMCVWNGFLRLILPNTKGEESLTNKCLFILSMYICLFQWQKQSTLAIICLIYICTLMEGWWSGCVSVEYHVFPSLFINCDFHKVSVVSRVSSSYQISGDFSQQTSWS